MEKTVYGIRKEVIVKIKGRKKVFLKDDLKKDA
jgi:hypothetical protein